MAVVLVSSDKTPVMFECFSADLHTQTGLVGGCSPWPGLTARRCRSGQWLVPLQTQLQPPRHLPRSNCHLKPTLNFICGGLHVNCAYIVYGMIILHRDAGSQKDAQHPQWQNYPGT